jgi:hypothetical protein
MRVVVEEDDIKETLTVLSRPPSSRRRTSTTGTGIGPASRHGSALTAGGDGGSLPAAHSHAPEARGAAPHQTAAAPTAAAPIGTNLRPSPTSEPVPSIENDFHRAAQEKAEADARALADSLRLQAEVEARARLEEAKERAAAMMRHAEEEARRARRLRRGLQPAMAATTALNQKPHHAHAAAHEQQRQIQTQRHPSTMGTAPAASQGSHSCDAGDAESVDA